MLCLINLRLSVLLGSFRFIQSSQTSIVALVQPPSLAMIKINKIMMMVMIKMREKYNCVMMLLMIKKRRKTRRAKG